MTNQWESTGIYEHPVRHQAGTYGQICKSGVGIYYLKVGGSNMSCPQGWAAKIHAEETGQIASPMSVRDVPEDLRNQFKAKAILEGKTMKQNAGIDYGLGMSNIDKDKVFKVSDDTEVLPTI